MEVKQTRAGQIEAHKRKLTARKSLGTGGSLLASEALQKIKDKRRKRPTKSYGRRMQQSLVLKTSRRKR
jgi:hypothetical protein